MAYATVTLTGTYHEFDGTPAKGHVRIFPSVKVVKDTTGNVILTNRHLEIRLDAQGAFSVDLPATDDPTLNPNNFGYTIAARLDHHHPKPVSFSLPASLGATTVEDLTPVDPATFAPTTTYAEKSELDAVAATIPTTAADVNALPDTTQIPSTAADIGAEPAGLSQATSDTLANTYAARKPLAGRIAEPSGQITWTPHATFNFTPRSVGVDGRLYFTYLNKTVMRSSDPALEVRTAGPDFTSKTPNTVIWAGRTTAGYVAITSDSTTDVAHIYFCPESAGFSANLDDWTMVQATKATTSIAIAQPRVIAGTSWLVMGEYVTGVYPSGVRKLWLSTDGGQTWAAIKDSTVNDNTVNSHWHCAVILPNGRIWASQGDGVNSWFGYTDDGRNWVPAPLPTTSPLYDGASVYQQPTVLLDLGDTLAAAPDRGLFTTGVWAVDPDTGQTVEWATLPSGEVTHTQYGSGAAQRGKEAYITYPDQGSGSAKTNILGTGDGGRSWHLVSTVDTTGGSAHGPLIGPDLNGRIYMQPTSGSIPTYGTGIMVGTLPTWA